MFHNFYSSLPIQLHLVLSSRVHLDLKLGDMGKKGGQKRKAAATSTMQRPAQEPSPGGTAEPAAAEQCEIAVPGYEEEPEPFSE